VDLNTFITSVFCLIDDRLKEWGPLRQRGPAPKLSDSEVLTIEVVGEFLGIDTDKAIYRYVRRHYAEWFPTLHEVHRTTFARHKPPKPLEGQGASLAGTPRARSSRWRLRHLRLDALGGVPVRSCLPLLSLQGRSHLR
jgi:hypothetical protein